MFRAKVLAPAWCEVLSKMHKVFLGIASEPQSATGRQQPHCPTRVDGSCFLNILGDRSAQILADCQAVPRSPFLRLYVNSRKKMEDEGAFEVRDMSVR